MTPTKGLETGVRVDKAATTDDLDIKDGDGETPGSVEDTSDSTEPASDDARPAGVHPPSKWLRARRIALFGILPILSVILAAGSGYLKWQVGSARDAETTRLASVQAATDNTIAILSYRPDSTDKELTAARDRLAEPFKDQYTKLITDVVIPGAKQKQISAIATVPAAASMSASANHAVVLVFIDQSIVIGADAPTTTSSTVRVTLDKDGDRWLISQFDPV
jgi:Mce-associated membrane protein